MLHTAKGTMKKMIIVLEVETDISSEDLSRKALWNGLVISEATYSHLNVKDVRAWTKRDFNKFLTIDFTGDCEECNKSHKP